MAYNQNPHLNILKFQIYFNCKHLINEKEFKYDNHTNANTGKTLAIYAARLIFDNWMFQKLWIPYETRHLQNMHIIKMWKNS